MNPEEQNEITTAYTKLIEHTSLWWRSRDANLEERRFNNTYPDSIEKSMRSMELEMELQTLLVEMISYRHSFYEVLKKYGFTSIKPFAYLNYTIMRVVDGKKQAFNLIKPDDCSL